VIRPKSLRSKCVRIFCALVGASGAGCGGTTRSRLDSGHGWFDVGSETSIGVCAATCVAIASADALQVTVGCPTIWRA
jgi:hypothetical protein